MKILQIIPQYKKAVGGPTFTIDSLKSVSNEVGDNLFVLASDHSDGFYNYPNVPILRSLIIFVQLITIKPDIVHIHGRLHLIISPILYKFINRKVKLIFTFHTQPVIHSYIPSKLVLMLKYRSYSSFITPVFSYLLNKYFRVTSVSSSIVDNLNVFTRLKIKNFDLVPSGAREVVFCNNDLIQLSKDSFNIATIGVLQWDWKVKGHLILIEILSRIIKEGNPKIKLYIFGDGNHLSMLNNVIENLGMTNNIVLCGNVQLVDMNLNQFDLYVHSGLNEGCSLALLEVIVNTNLHVIAFDEGGNREAVYGMTDVDVLKTDDVYRALKDRIEKSHVDKYRNKELRYRKVQSWTEIYNKYYN